MNEPSVRQALEQVRQIQQLVLSKQRFYGYSGKVRIVCGGLSLFTGWILSSLVPPEPMAQLAGWVVLLVVALAVNYAAVAFWFWNDEEVGRDWERLLPALEAIGPLALGGVFTVVFVWHGQMDLLFGMWMSLFGLAHITSRHLMPGHTGLLGLFYIFAGVGCLLFPGWGFTNPWPMALVFGIGEITGGLLMQRDHEDLRRQDHE